MKKFLLIAIVGIIIILAGCTKTVPQSPEAATTVPGSGTAVADDARTRPNILTAHPWMYRGFYLHYIDQAHKGDPQYVRGSSSNIIDLDGTWITYKKNGTFLETENGYEYPGTWNYTNSADTVLVMAFSYGTDVNTIITINNNNLNYKMPIGSYSHNNFAYTELMSAN